MKGHNMYKCHYTGPIISFTHIDDPEKHLFLKLRVKIPLMKQDKKGPAFCNSKILFKYIIYYSDASIRAIGTLEKCQNNI